MTALGLFNYWAVIVLMMVGFYTLIARDNLVKKLIGLNIFQTSVIMMYVSFGACHRRYRSDSLPGRSWRGGR